MKKKRANILIGVCGGIAAYKVCQLIRLFIRDGHSVKVMMTPAATQFIQPLVFKELTGQPVYSRLFGSNQENTQHIKLSEWANLAIVAPLSANTLSKVSCGICDNLVTTALCAFGVKLPVLLVPSMNENMWNNPIIQKNLTRLKEIKNYTILMPESGELACGRKGVGRMAEPKEIRQKVNLLLK